MQHHTGRDITDRNDVEFFLRNFYGRVLIHPFLAEKFNNVNLEEHIPVITSFWCSIILYEEGYASNPFAKHRELGLTAEHFKEWLRIFHDVIDELFTGPNTVEMKKRADTLAQIFQHKLGIDPQS